MRSIKRAGSYGQITQKVYVGEGRQTGALCTYPKQFNNFFLGDDIQQA
jgi:hypothetical protein